MTPFAYARAFSLDEAITAGAVPQTVFLAGGTELLNWLRLGISMPKRRRAAVCASARWSASTLLVSTIP